MGVGWVWGGGEWSRSWSLTASPPVGGVVPIRQPHTSTQRRRSSFIKSSSCVDGKQKFGSSVAFARTLARPLGRKRERELLFYPGVGGEGLVGGWSGWQTASGSTAGGCCFLVDFVYSKRLFWRQRLCFVVAVLSFVLYNFFLPFITLIKPGKIQKIDRHLIRQLNQIDIKF